MFQNPGWQIRQQIGGDEDDKLNSMSQELAYAIITPYSLHKSRTGGIFARSDHSHRAGAGGRPHVRPQRGTVAEYCREIVFHQ